MRNIALSNCESRFLKNLKNCEAFCHDGQTIYAYDKGNVLKSQATGDEVIFNLRDKLFPSIDEKLIPKALELSYCCEKNTLYVILLDGDIVSLQENGSVDIVGSVADGIKAAKWSPEQEVIAMVTGSDKVLIMTNDFDPLSEVDLHGGGFGEKQFITVGWGKKETQFRGSEGKFKETDKKQESCEKSDKSSHRIKIAWRGDAQYFLVSCINPNTCRRYLRIFSKAGSLQYTSEDLDGLEHPLDWSPSGSLITSSQVLSNKYNICFFEKNGLKHGEFTLPKTHQEIVVDEVLWSKDSKILALLITKITDQSYMYSDSIIMLYTVNNYHWYHKYTLNFQYDFKLQHVQWDNQKYNIMHVVLQNEKKVYYNKYTWLWTVNKSKVTGLNDESLVAVIDGNKLKLTSFNRGIVPPPMCTHEILLPCPINSVSFAPDIQDVFSSKDICIHLSNNDMQIYKAMDNDSMEINYEFFGEIKNYCTASECCLNIYWVDKNIFLVSLVKTDEKTSIPLLYVLDVSFNDPSINFVKREITLKSAVAIVRVSKETILIHDNNGDIYSFSRVLRKLENTDANSRSFIDLEIKDNENGGFSYIGLDNLNKFYVNNNNVLSNVLSFHVHDNFIFVTTMKHELICLNIDMVVTGDDLSGIYSRKVERGSRIVTSVQKDMKLILQMPRGNLECIQPRPLALFALGKYLDSLNYYKAFSLMRKQRINLNLLYDHNPELFRRNVHIFVGEIRDLQWLNLFISDLSDEDVTKSMYANICKKKNSENSIDQRKKIDTVCNLIENILIERSDSERFTLPLLTCYIKRGKTEFYEKALLKIKELKLRELAGRTSDVTFEEAFKHITYFIDVEELYKVALGMYDFDLAMMLANKSQKDPKEYMPFINELRQLEPNYQKFKVDKYLRRNKKALAHLVKCEGDDTFSECIHFIKTHKLYKYALKLISENTDRYKNVCICYGDELMKNSCFEEAGIMYSNGGRYKNALAAYRRAGNWQEVLFWSKELKFSETELDELYLDLAMELCESKQYQEAAVIYTDYLKDIPEALRTLSQGKLFAEAYRIAQLHQSTHLIPSLVEPEIVEHASRMQALVFDLHEVFVIQKDRLKELREQKKKAEEDKKELEDFYSETNSVVTQSNATSCNTNRSYRSAKNRRKLQRKLLSLKEGNPYEELALVSSLHSKVTNCVSLKPEVKELIKFLAKIGEYVQAEDLQKQYREFLKIAEDSISEIWSPEFLKSKRSYIPDTTANDISAIFLKSENIASILLNNKHLIAPEIEKNEKWELEIVSP